MSHFLYKHKLISGFFILWSMVLVSWVTWRVFGASPPDIPGSTVAALGTVFGLPGIGLGIWQWRNDKKEKPDAE